MRYEQLSDVLDIAEPGSEEYVAAFREMELLANAGVLEAAEAIAGIYGSPSLFYSAEKAYHWYYIALAQQGYTTSFDDQNGTPPYYCGPVDDFRNEAQVSSLVEELGFVRVQAIDRIAEAWLREKRDA